ncbi:hypothetical protein LOTGIDRAFT_152167 [Lottia gigantea]|uniref:Uncharacterized protein n=1 Tax=Lottia gigantea TaxID=225164 RepID=V4B4E7_LOTGI|nr:hypothetical protein LOTGIDRAFT_152167 [Lottia gigantea]ESP05328.1 hypothetical protein LOTGIDRAFT_152167 [Lottia gigantea]
MCHRREERGWYEWIEDKEMCQNSFKTSTSTVKKYLQNNDVLTKEVTVTETLSNKPKWAEKSESEEKSIPTMDTFDSAVLQKIKAISGEDISHKHASEGSY